MVNTEHSITVLCYHCGNITLHEQDYNHKSKMLYEEVEEKRYFEEYEFVVYICGTCGGLSLYGDFTEFPQNREFSKKRLYPLGSAILPPSHMLAGTNPIPPQIFKMYEEIWPLRFRAPNAFVAQIRRALEFICTEKGANGTNLFAKLKDLVNKDVFPGYISEITDILRKVGNIGAHASEQETDIWDAELIDDFFRFILEYLYIAPSKIERMKRRIHSLNP